MLKKFLFALAALLVLAAGAAADVTVLLYHRVGDSRHPSTNVSTEGFREEMRWLKEAGYTVVSTAKLEGYLTRGEPMPEKAVALHFDDGLRTVYTNAFPILKEFGYPFTLFLTTDPIDKGYPDYVTWEMVAQMAKAGGEVAVHGHAHEKLGSAAKGEDKAAFARRIANELNDPKGVLKARGYPSAWIAYSFGEYGPELIKAARENGFTLGFVQDSGSINRESDPFLLPRYAVVGSVADFSLVKERLTYRALNLFDQSPPYGLMTGDAPAVFSARVKNPEKYLPASVGVYVSELGGLKATFDPATGLVKAAGGRKLTRKLNRVVISLKEKESGRFALGSWAILKGND